MSRTSEAQTHVVDGEIHCSCGKTLAKHDGIKCRCGAKSSAIHFYPNKAISGGTIEDDWRVHLDRARIVGCDICGIEPEWKSQQHDAKKAREIHFYPGRALGGGSIESDWQAHRREARYKGCGICGIKPEPLSGKTTDERWFELQDKIRGQNPRVDCSSSPSADAAAPVTPAAPEYADNETTVATPQGSTGSHSLAVHYAPVPATLDTRGTDYPLPVFGTPDPMVLYGARVLVISADAPELPEIHVPMGYLRDRGATVKLAGQDWIFQYRNPAGHIVIGQWMADNICVKADLRLSDVNLDDFDAVFIPGGAWNPDMLRTDDAALRIVREAHRRGLLIVSLCHGPQVLINAAFDAPEGQINFPSRGVHITGTGSIRRDLKNAGFIVHNDDATVFDASANLLTARDPNDLGAMCERFGELLRQRLQTS